MRNPSSSSRSVRPLAAALLLGAAFMATESAAPAAHAISRTAAVATLADAGGGAHARPGVAGRLVRPQRRFRARAARSSSRIRPRIARAVLAPASVGDDVWAKLRRCESGGRYDINTGNGFYGAYQFVLSTWRGLGYSGMPHHAPPEMQDEAARKLQARSGWGQWPVCSRRIGARQRP